jgi:hypothetical protein
MVKLKHEIQKEDDVKLKWVKTEAGINRWAATTRGQRFVITEYQNPQGDHFTLVRHLSDAPAKYIMSARNMELLKERAEELASHN